MPRGGKRSGAGRKKGQVDEITKLKNEALSALADAVFEKVDKVATWVAVLKADDPKLKLDALKYLEDRQSGRAIPAADPQKNKQAQITVRIEYVGKS
jgi:hypothetical protein